MGTSTSRRMDDSDSRSRSDDSSDQDSDLTAILQYLIRSGQVHIISSNRDDSEDEFVAAASPPRMMDSPPNTKELDKSEISLATQQACGLIHSSGHERPNSIAAMINARERGMFGRSSFTQGDRCKITNNYIPNKMKTVATYHSKAFCGTYSEDGNYFLTACQDRNLRLYCTTEGKFEMLKTIQARDVGWSVLDTAFSPDGNYIVYSSWSECLHLCRLYGDSETQDALPLCPEERRFCIFSLVFSSDGREILGGANDGFLYVYDRECNQRALRIEGHDDDVNTVAFADSTSQILYSGGDDGLCKVWDRRTLSELNPKPVGVLAGHMDGVTYIDPRGDGRHLISNCKDQSIKLWDVRVFSGSSGQNNTRKAVSDQTWDYRWQKVPKKLSNPKKNLEGDTSVMTYRGHRVLQTLVRCHFSPEFITGQRYIYTGCAAGRVVIYDVLTGKVHSVLSGHRACVRDVSWHPHRQELISTSWDGTLGRWTYSGKIASAIEDADITCRLDQGFRGLRRSRRIAQQRERQQKSQDAPEQKNVPGC
ncbi:DDB1- and CUL4-associated factor 11 [Cryptotermes secundus]|uniref:DDB1-and CUL4-associated factor 11 n=2 Tax=Cryptotermes secundus TaxID=105785 RepID=A0A2J7PUW0_9NEOP|nr:DDB1- and CUL4-associated factor 11 isoform X1 [Cryptotermes secundus]PNF20119.1 DDB1- and CUL4-associated factor 11 [Cryptotermes secundus]